jgi:hypothetical protein
MSTVLSRLPKEKKIYAKKEELLNKKRNSDFFMAAGANPRKPFQMKYLLDTNICIYLIKE